MLCSDAFDVYAAEDGGLPLEELQCLGFAATGQPKPMLPTGAVPHVRVAGDALAMTVIADLGELPNWMPRAAHQSPFEVFLDSSHASTSGTE